MHFRCRFKILYFKINAIAKYTLHEITYQHLSGPNYIYACTINYAFYYNYAYIIYIILLKLRDAIYKV